MVLTATPLFFQSEFSVAVEGRGPVTAFFQGGVVIAVLAFTRLGSRLGSRAVTLGFSLMTAGLFLISTTQSIVQIVLGSTLTGIGFGTFTSLGQEFAAGAASAAFRGLAVSMMVATIRVAQTLSPPAASLVTDRISARATFIGAAGLVALLTLTWRPLRSVAAGDRVSRH